MLAKVICSSTDHGERGNKDRYIFEFRLKRTSSMPALASNHASSSSSSEAPEDEGETLSACFTHPIMCSGHHKAKRAYPNQRPVKVTKTGPTPKMKTIKRHKSAPNIIMPPAGSHHAEVLGGSGPMAAHNHLGFPPAMAFLPDHLSQVPTIESSASRSNSVDFRSSTHHPFAPSVDSSSETMPQHSVQHPRIIEVRPDHGPIRKKTDVILRGLFFREGMVPYFGCLPALDIIVETANLIVCKAPESSLPGTVAISIYDHAGNNFPELGQFTYTDDSETELLILQLQLKLAHRALEYLHKQATGQRGNAADIMKTIPGLTPSQSGNMMDMLEAADIPMMSLHQVEESILDTLNNLPKDVDISLQLEDGSNLLHLSILLRFDRLAFRLIDEGCDIEAQDIYSMTPLMYAVLYGNEALARHLVLAGATSSGARTPQEFYSRLPRRAEPTSAMYWFLSVSCARFFNAALSPSTFISDALEEEETDMDGVYPQEDEVEDGGESEESCSQIEGEEDAGRLLETSTTVSTATRSSIVSEIFSRLADTVQDVSISSSDQQDLPPDTVPTDSSFVVDNETTRKAVAADPATIEHHRWPYQYQDITEMLRNANPESGYHSGVLSEVQEHLQHIHTATLPSEGVKMEVSFRRLSQSAPPAAPLSERPQSMTLSSIPLELYRTGDSFAIEIRLTTPSSSSSDLPEEHDPMPQQHLGIRFPQEMVKRVGGRQACVLTENAYILKVSIEQGDLSIPVDQLFEKDQSHHGEEHGYQSFGDGTPLTSVCQACSKFLHEHKSLSPSRRSMTDPSHYPILQFYIPSGTSSSTSLSSLWTSSSSPSTAVSSLQSSTVNPNDSGVVELHDGVCEVRAKVNCSSLHHLIQSERVKRQAELQRQQQLQISQGQQPAADPYNVDQPQRSLALTDLVDPGFVFKFELVHPTLRMAVAHYETKPILFQSYSRRRT
ncbi:MAG: hypothetical protein J3Q66DRAFT_346386 [Benniella sp.]|nr:MAG: hypothetical protein J3Q66DRAFT_346386 [Benniella sp.]